MWAVIAITVWGGVQLALGTTVYAWATEIRVAEWVLRAGALYAGWKWAGERFVQVAYLVGFAVSVAAVMAHFLVPGLPEGTMWPFAYHNQFAAFEHLLIPVGLWMAFARGRVGWGLMSAWMIASVVLANSRAGAVIALAEVPLVALLCGRLRRGLAVAAAAMLFTGVVGWERLVEKFGYENPYGARWELLLSTVDMGKERPWMGWGLGTWAAVYPAYARFDDGLYDNQAHNDWAQWGAEGGVPLLGMMVWFAAMVARPALRTVWGLGLLTVLVHCLLEYHFQQRAAFGYFYFAMAGAVLSGYGKSVPGLAAKDGD